MSATWVKIGLSMIGDLVDQAQFALPQQVPTSRELSFSPQEQFDRSQGRRSAPAKENIPRIVSMPE